MPKVPTPVALTVARVPAAVILPLPLNVGEVYAISPVMAMVLPVPKTTAEFAVLAKETVPDIVDAEIVPAVRMPETVKFDNVPTEVMLFKAPELKVPLYTPP